MTPLHWATFNDDIQTAQLLLNYGARLSFNNRNQTPIDIAGFCRLTAMVELFI